MNGDNTIWADGTSTLEPIVWDDYAKLSSPGLGVEGTNKTSFIGSGETQTFDLSDFGLTSFDPTTFDTLGVRATSVNGTGTIKWVDTTPDTGQFEGPGIGLATVTAVDEELNDVSLTASGGQRIVYSAAGAGGTLDLFAFTHDSASLPSPTSPLQPLAGTFTPINLGAGDQTNPHVSGDIVVYSTDTPSPQIRYFVATNTDNVVPTSGFAAFLSDVSNGHIVYTGLSSTGPFAGSYIFEFNLADSTTTAIGDSNKTSNPTVSAGGDVAYESGAFSANPAETEIVVTELQPGGVQLTTRITDDAMKDSNPQISTDGNHVVWQKGLTTGTGLDIWVADKTAPGVWTSTQLTGASGEDVRPDISGDGRFVTWTSTIAGATDVYVLDRNDNTTYQFDIAGDQRNPSVTEDGKYISFESNETGAQYDIVLASNPLHDDFIM
jgi:WD40-like Beta Propeller Repeat